MKKINVKKKHIVLLAAAVIIAAVLIVLFATPLFVIGTVDTSCAYGCTPEEEIFLQEQFEHKNALFAFGLGEKKARTAEEKIKFDNPFVKSIKIGYVFPNKVKVTSEARSEAFYAEYYGDYLLLDSEGVLLKTVSEDEGTLPVIIGLNVSECKTGNSVFDGKDKNADNAIRLCSLLKAYGFYETGVDMIDMGDPDCIWMYFAPELSVKFGKTDGMDEKIAKLKGILEAGYDRNAKGTIDFTVGKNPVFRENKKENPEETAEQNEEYQPQDELPEEITDGAAEDNTEENAEVPENNVNENE